jgi:hypothetical protein
LIFKNAEVYMKNINRKNRKGNLGHLLPTGGIQLKREHRQLVASQWKPFHANLRFLDQLQIEEIEPATIFLWNRYPYGNP